MIYIIIPLMKTLLKKIIKYFLIFLLVGGALYGLGRLGVVWYDSTKYVDRQPYLQNTTMASTVVRWQTPEKEKGCVVYGITDYDKERCDESKTQYHRVELNGLKKATIYRYKVLSDSLKIDNDGRSFSTLDDNDSMKQTIWVLGDSGNFNKSQQLVKEEMFKHLNGQKVDTWIMLGDNAYRSGTQEQYNRGMFNAYPEMFKTNTLRSVIGNHDARRWAYYDIMEHPTKGEAGGVASGSEKYYAFNQGDVHFVMLDSQTEDRSSDGDMAQWLKKDLAANKKLWTIAVFHHPPYTKGSHDSDSDYDSRGRMVDMRENFLPILETYDVDLVLAGHSHVYERSDLMHGHYGYSNTFDPAKHVVQSGTDDYTKCLTKKADDGTLYIVAGAASAHQYGISPFNALHPAMKMGYFTDGSLLLHVDGVHLSGEYVTNDGTVLDTFSIKKENECRK